jgi:dTMP kinase
MSGSFITFEGGEGAGKSTQIARLEDALRAAGHKVLKTREPGGSEGAELIRDLMVTGAANRWDAKTELLLANAARRDHVTKTILPALQDGDIVLCDRFVHSTLAYQVGRDGVTDALVRRVHKDLIGDLWPSLTFVFDLEPKIAMARIAARDGEKQGRFEQMGSQFHADLRDRFAQMAQEDQGCMLINASQPIEDVFNQIWDATLRHLERSA